MRRSRFAAFAAAAFLLARPAAASCGSTTCFLVTHSEEGVETAGAFQIDLSYQYVDQSKKLAGNDGVTEVLVPKVDFEAGEIEPDHHREVSTHGNFVRADLAYGITSRLSAFAHIPLFVEKDHEHFDEAGTPEETFTSGDGTRGFGDVAVGVRYAFLVKAKDLLMASLAVELPKIGRASCRERV